MTTYGVCVGGPMDRKMFASPGKVFRVCGPTPVPRATDWAASEAAMDSSLSVRTHLYHLEEIALGSNVICFWRHESLSVFDAMYRVFSKYVRKSRA